MGSKKPAQFSPGQIVLFSMLITIIIGTVLLALPYAQQTPMPLIDLFFTATSATCVTGLFTISLDNFTLFGKSIILLLIQIGGLGLITMTLIFLSMFANLGLGAQLMAGQLLEIESWKHIRKLLIFILLVTLLTEAIGMVCMLPVFTADNPFAFSCFLSLFHAVSSFCNAGISILGDSMQQYSTNYTMLLTTTALIFVGGLGFITWYEIMQYARSLNKKKRHRFSLHSKIVLYGSIALLISSAVTFWILEHDNILAPLNIPQTISQALFQAVSFRSTGFLITFPGEFQLATLFLIMAIAFIGSAPGSTGSGIKITTLAVFLATVKAAVTGRTAVEIKGRRIPLGQVFKAIAIIFISFGWIALTTFCLLITEKGWNFMDLAFEATSAFTTLGITTGVTPTLSTTGKLFIIASMIVGRIGSFTLILALKLKKRAEVTAEFQYPEERVMLG